MLWGDGRLLPVATIGSHAGMQNARQLCKFGEKGGWTNRRGETISFEKSKLTKGGRFDLRFYEEGDFSCTHYEDPMDIAYRVWVEPADCKITLVHSK